MDTFLEQWRFNRELTLDLLSSLADSELEFSPGPGIGQLWKQFRHVGRVQENYMNALESGRVQFTTADGAYRGAASARDLRRYLEGLDGRLLAALSSPAMARQVDWFGERVSAREHLMRLLSHEVLHHGQWIVQMRLLNRPFPESWGVWGL